MDNNRRSSQQVSPKNDQFQPLFADNKESDEPRSDTDTLLRRATASKHPPLSPQDILTLQRTIGNQAVQQLLIRRQQEEQDQSTEPLAIPSFEIPIGFIQRTPADALVKAVSKKAIKWLAKRAKTISPHVARHTRDIARAGIHSIFKQAGKVKSLVRKTIGSPDRVVTALGKRKGNLGKKLIYFKDFGRVIGKNGEQILKVVVHKKTGEIITAYPVKTMAAALAVGSVFSSIDEAAAATHEELNKIDQEAQRRLEASEPSFWEELLSDVLTFGLYGGQANQGEQVWLWVRRQVENLVKKVYLQVVKETELREKRQLSESERKAILDLVRSAITIKDVLQETE